MESIIASCITGGLALIGVVITVKSSQRKTEISMKSDLAVINNEVKNLRREVEKHNNFAERIPKLEALQQEDHKHIARLESFHME